MATASGIQDRQHRLPQLIDCPICLNELDDPRLLSCRHIYCYKCLIDYQRKGNHGNALPCPQCGEVTTIYQGGVDNLPKYFFMNVLKEVVMEMTKDAVEEGRQQNHRDVVCFGEDCGKPGVKYCIRCQSHKHQLMDLYCCTCNIPICTTCSHGNHSGHTCCELDKQAEVCKTKLEQICEDTDGLIHVVKQAMDKTTRQVKQAEEDIDGACENDKSAFKIMPERLKNDEKKMLSNLQAARRRVKKTGDVTADSQMITLASLQSLKSCQVKLADKDSPYDYVTITDSMQRDVDNHYNKELPGIMWTSQIKMNSEIRHQGLVDMAESAVTENVRIDKQVKEVSRIDIHAPDYGILTGMVVYHQRVYVVYHKGLIVYCYTPDGSLSHKYEHKGGEKASVRGMCLMKDEDTAMLVISDVTSKSLIWIQITDDVTMDHHHTLPLDYSPRGSCVDQGDLMVCDPDNHKIHRYAHDGQTLTVINLPHYVNPWGVTRDGDQYVVSDYSYEQVVLIDNKGQEKTSYKDDIQGVKMRGPRGIITDPHRGVLMANYDHNQVLLLRRTGDVVKILDQHVKSPNILYLDTDHDTLYVSRVHQVCLFNYTLLTDSKNLTMKITKLDMKVEI